MRVLLVKPRHLAAHFGLAPFFRTEPLGLECLRPFRPELAGISCRHILDGAATLRHTGEIQHADLAEYSIPVDGE